MSFQERIEQARQNHGRQAAVNNNEPGESFNSEFYGVENARNPIYCIDLRFADGSRKAIPYSYVQEMSFDGESIEISTTSKKVTIKGRDMKRLYDHLTAYRVKYIQENMGTDAGQEGLFIARMTITES